MSGMPPESDVVELVVHHHDVLRRMVTGFNETPHEEWEREIAGAHEVPRQA